MPSVGVSEANSRPECRCRWTIGGLPIPACIRAERETKVNNASTDGLRTGPAHLLRMRRTASTSPACRLWVEAGLRRLPKWRLLRAHFGHRCRLFNSLKADKAPRDRPAELGGFATVRSATARPKTGHSSFGSIGPTADWRLSAADMSKRTFAVQRRGSSRPEAAIHSPRCA